MKTKTFPLRTILTVTTGRLLTTSKNGGNGIEDLYEILGWMTNDSPFTHQLGRFADECKPVLIKAFPELVYGEAGLKSLDEWMSKDRTPDKSEGIKMWLTELKMMFPQIKDAYDVPQIVGHQPKDPIQELVELRGGSTEGIIVVKT